MKGPRQPSLVHMLISSTYIQKLDSVILSNMHSCSIFTWKVHFNKNDRIIPSWTRLNENFLSFELRLLDRTVPVRLRPSVEAVFDSLVLYWSNFYEQRLFAAKSCSFISFDPFETFDHLLEYRWLIVTKQSIFVVFILLKLYTKNLPRLLTWIPYNQYVIIM